MSYIGIFVFCFAPGVRDMADGVEDDVLKKTHAYVLYETGDR